MFRRTTTTTASASSPDPGGRSALRAATKKNPRNRPCPTCGEPNRLTPKDVAPRYQCDECADAQERGGCYTMYEVLTDILVLVLWVAFCKMFDEAR